jgi:hypothetical protein
MRGRLAEELRTQAFAAPVFEVAEQGPDFSFLVHGPVPAGRLGPKDGEEPQGECSPTSICLITPTTAHDTYVTD